jgi:predicted  nucleic acid-binding Zn-ribbon protein
VRFLESIQLIIVRINNRFVSRDFLLELLGEKDAEHEQSMATLQKDIAESRDELVKLLKAVSTLSSLTNSSRDSAISFCKVAMDCSCSASFSPRRASLTDQIQDVLAQKQHFSEKYAELMGTNEDLRKQLESAYFSEKCCFWARTSWI